MMSLNLAVLCGLERALDRSLTQFNNVLFLERNIPEDQKQIFTELWPSHRLALAK